MGNTASEVTFSRVVGTINEQRREWKLPPIKGFNGMLSGLILGAQLPAELSSGRCAAGMSRREGTATMTIMGI
jgi:hypothetical protein